MHVSPVMCIARRLKQSLTQYRYWVEEERRVSSDPIKHQAFLTVRHAMLWVHTHKHVFAQHGTILHICRLCPL
jgi:hypothetical protein